jgi:streptogramin lyase
MTIDKNDNIWMALNHNGTLTKFDQKTEKFTEYRVPTTPEQIRRLGLGTDGLTIWSGSFATGTLVKLDPKTGKTTQWKIPSQVSEPYDFITQGKYVWVSDGGQGGALIRFDTDEQSFTFFPTPQITDLPKIRVTKEGSIWYCPRTGGEPGVGVLHPDMTKITSLAGF